MHTSGRSYRGRQLQVKRQNNSQSIADDAYLVQIRNIWYPLATAWHGRFIFVRHSNKKRENVARSRLASNTEKVDPDLFQDMDPICVAGMNEWPITDLPAYGTVSCCWWCLVDWRWPVALAYVTVRWRGRSPAPTVSSLPRHLSQTSPGRPPWRCWRSTNHLRGLGNERCLFMNQEFKIK